MQDEQTRENPLEFLPSKKPTNYRKIHKLQTPHPETLGLQCSNSYIDLLC